MLSNQNPSPASTVRPPRRRGVVTLACAAALSGLLLAACSETPVDDEATQLSDFRARAAAGASSAWTATYTLSQTDGVDATAEVAHTADSVRIDIDSKASSGITTSTSITTPDGVIACLTPEKEPAQCLIAAEAGEDPPAALDPGLRTVLGQALQSLGQGFGTVEVVADQPGASENALCARVIGEDVPEGVYCLAPDGVPELVSFRSGSITLAERGDAPAADAFEPPASPKPTL